MVLGFSFDGAMAVTDGTSSILNSWASSAPAETKRARTVSIHPKGFVDVISKPVRCAKNSPGPPAGADGEPHPPTTSGNPCRARPGGVTGEHSGAGCPASPAPAHRDRLRNNPVHHSPRHRSTDRDCGTHTPPIG